MPFIALGIALFAIGLTGRPALIALGVAFWVAGLLMFRPCCRPR